MQQFDSEILKNLYLPPPDSHKGENGRLLLVGGSRLFHAASLWALTAASRIVDMVFYASVPENNQIVQNAKQEFRNGIVVGRNDIESYAKEANCIVIGPGMERAEHGISNIKFQISNLQDINKIEEGGVQTYFLTKYLLEKFPDKKWVIDAGALQMMELEWFKKLQGNIIITPHQQEFERVFKLKPTAQNVGHMAKEYGIVILLKGQTDTVCSPKKCIEISGGNAGMTKGGTGDVLAGLIGGLACKNDLFLSAVAGSYFNKKAGDALYKKVGPFFNASDLANEIPGVMKEELDL
jgi:NAD(P)H-hydrate epimerase